MSPKSSLLGILATGLLAAPCTAQVADSLPGTPDAIVAWLGKHWTAEAWGADGSARYMRSQDDAGWKARMLALQALAKAGEKAVPALLAALVDGPVETRIFAAQALGFVPAKSAEDALLAALTGDSSDAVRLYAADAIGMNGHGEAMHAKLGQLRGQERNRDVKKHIDYVLGRGAVPVDPAVIKQLASWDASRMGAARLGEPAPEFELKAINGGTVRLRDYRGKSPVVLVFIYGDT